MQKRQSIFGGKDLSSYVSSGFSAGLSSGNLFHLPAALGSWLVIPSLCKRMEAAARPRAGKEPF